MSAAAGFAEAEAGEPALGTPALGATGTGAAGIGRDRDGATPPVPPRGPEQLPGEVDGPPGPEPTRFGDWEKGGRCTDF